MGGIPSLANLTTKDEIFKSSYIISPSVVNPEGTVPREDSEWNGNILDLPEFFNRVYRLNDIIDVDYYLPGCPPTAKMVGDAVMALLSGELPPQGSVLASNKALCSSCSRNDSKPDNMQLKEVKRIHQIEADPEICFIAQDVLCMGPATRDGCDYPCVLGNMPCTGCMGPVKDSDQGARMIGALGGILEGKNEDEMENIIDGIVDPAGTFYRYCIGDSILGSVKKKERNDG
jgi:F420-non-reducing hydrogenase small subunit